MKPHIQRWTWLGRERYRLSYYQNWWIVLFDHGPELVQGFCNACKIAVEHNEDRQEFRVR